MTTIESVLFTALLIVSLFIFFRRLYVLLALVFLGKFENRFDHLWQRFKGMIEYGFLQKRVVQKAFGINHFMLFWGFMVLLLVNIEFVISGIFPKFSLDFIGHTPYIVLNFLADIMSVVVLFAVVFALARRIFFKPSYIEATPEAFLILSTVGVLMMAYFGINVTANSLGTRTCSNMPVSLLLSSFFSKNADPATMYVFSKVFWWTHAVMFLFFLDFIPYSKHLHILASLPNCFFRSLSFVSSLPRLVFSKDSSLGVSKIVHFTWKDLLDFMACTECGRCQAACPAKLSGKSLNPKEVILHCKSNLFENGSSILASRPFDTIGRVPDSIDMDVPIIGEGKTSISRDSIWDCTTCGACMDKCPVFIEHPPKLMSMRRHLVMEKVEFPEELVLFFENIEQRSNPWGIAPTERAKWAQNLDVPRFSEKESHEYLLYTGCLGAYDSRAKKVSSSLVEIMNKASISYGILGSEEMCCGDSMRRLGNEYVFDKIAKDNVSLFKKMAVKKIITICPHCYNTLKNDYKDYGADFEVYHHTEILQEIYDKGLFKSNNRFRDEKIVIHDSCYLGRYNNIYEEPRHIIKKVAGKSPMEMNDKRQNSFCCGAGGGRMWLEENADTRVNRERTKQALMENPTIVATCCPYCITMFEDGLKDENKQGAIKVMDIVELFHEGTIALDVLKEADDEQIKLRRAANE
jgi:Fe-S oxidoreductase